MEQLIAATSRVELDENSIFNVIKNKGYCSIIGHYSFMEKCTIWCEENGYEYKIYKLEHFEDVEILRYKIIITYGDPID